MMRRRWQDVIRLITGDAAGDGVDALIAQKCIVQAIWQMRIVLDAGRGLDWTVADMKTKILAAFAGISMVLLAAGCISTVSGTKSPAMSWSEDRFAGQYERSPDQVYRAALTVLTHTGVLITEYIPHDVTNSEPNSVRAMYGKVNERKVWIRVEPVNPTVTGVTVQARTKIGWTDQDLVHELEKEIALQLQSMR